ncbi:MAG: TIGR02452 family protein [Acholeplasmatales bacterium]|nr:TIGR02452 family protein [Acholeplasmatales bacterium]
MNIIIVKGDITNALVDAVVNAANSRLSPASGECGAIFNKAGYDKLKEACSRLGYCKPGSSVITPGFDMDAEYIIHTVGPIYHENDKDNDLILAEAYISALNLALENKCLSVAFPALSTGIYNYPYDLAANIAISTLYEYKKIHDNDFANIYIYCYDDEIYKAFKNEERRYVNSYKFKTNIVELEAEMKLKMDLVNVFKDTRSSYIEKNYLISSIKNTKANTKLYDEDYIGNKVEKDNDAKIILERNYPTNSLRSYASYGRLGILNSGDGTHPGGNVLSGFIGGEENLARVSTLFACLNDETGNLYENYYGLNKKSNYLNSNKIIYSPGVTIFKKENVIPEELMSTEWVDSDVITSAAPNLNNIFIVDTELKELFFNRLKQVFEVSAANNIDCLILSSYGINQNINQGIIKEIYEKLIDEYKKYFKYIIISLPDSNGEESPEYKSFKKMKYFN